MNTTAMRVQRNASENNCYRLEPLGGFNVKYPKYRKIVKKKWVGNVI